MEKSAIEVGQTRLGKAKRGNSAPLEPRLANLILHPRSTEKVARPPNAFMIFAREHRKTLAEKYPEHSNKVISSMLGKWWKEMSDSAKKKYFDQSKLMHELHQQQHPGYVYSPRVARMVKQEKKRVRKLKAHSKELKKETDEQNGTVIFFEVEDTEANCPELKPVTPEYVPNNPQFFSNETQPAETHKEETSSMTSEDHAQSTQHWSLQPSLRPSSPSLQPSPPPFPPSPPPLRLSPPSFRPSSSLGRAPEELGMQPLFLEPYYRPRPPLCACVQCEEKRAYAYGPPMYPRWNPYSMDYMNEYGALPPSFEHNRSYHPSTEHPDSKNYLFSSYQHYPIPAPLENSHRFQYNLFHDYRTGCHNCSSHCMRGPMSYEDNRRIFYGNPFNAHLQHPGWFPDSRYSYFRSGPAFDSCPYPIRPETKQYNDKVQYRDLDSNSLRSSWGGLKSEPFDASDNAPNIGASSFATENIKNTNGETLEANLFPSSSMETIKNPIGENTEADPFSSIFMEDIKNPNGDTVEADPFLSSTLPVEEETSVQVDNTSEHPCLQTTDSSQSEQFHDCEGIPLEMIPTNFHANDSNGQDVMILTNDSSMEPNFYDFEYGKPPSHVASYAYYQSDVGFQFEGLVNQDFKSSDDPLINVVDVGEAHPNSNIEAKEALVEKTDAQDEQCIH